MSRRIILGLVRDLFFRSKLDAVAESAGVDLLYASDLDAAAKRCADLHPALILVDLSDASFPAVETATQLRGAASEARMIGFASHIDLKPLRAAKEAGFDSTLSRSEFTAKLPDLLKQ